MKVLCVLSKYAYGRPERGENYDYVHFVPAFVRMGHEVDVFDSGDRSRYRDFAALNADLLRRVVEFRPDMIFCVLMHYEVWSETLDIIRANSPVLVINWGTDDSWKFDQASRFFAEHVDLHVTTDFAAEEAGRSRGLENIFLSQWAASESALADPRPAQECEYDVSFVGSIYGHRAKWISALRQGGIAVSCFGHGTEHGVVDAADIPGIYRNSRISLNFSGAGQRAGEGGGNRQIKARTFEVPGAGGFLLTEAVSGLDRYFALGREVATFASPRELVEKVRYYLANPDERDCIARSGYERTRADHTYEARFASILRRVETMKRARGHRPWTISVESLSRTIEIHRDNGAIKWVRWLLVVPLSLIFGRIRGARAARRVVFELSWRLAGARTYSARGWPGRLFYRES
jgi:spore maturation protein CgeB